MDISNQEKQQGESFLAFFTRTSFRTDQTRQKTLCFNSLATLFLSCLHQPECVPYTLCAEVYGALCSQINNSKLCILRQVSKGILKAVKKLYIYRLKNVCTWIVSGLWTLNIFSYEIPLSCGTFIKHDREPLFGNGNTFNRGQPVSTCTFCCHVVQRINNKIYFHLANFSVIFNIS